MYVYIYVYIYIYIYILYIHIHRKLPHSGHLQSNFRWACSPKLAAIRVSTVLYDYFHCRLLTDYFLFFVTFCIFPLFHDIYFLTCLLTWLFACLIAYLPTYFLTIRVGPFKGRYISDITDNIQQYRLLSNQPIFVHGLSLVI